MTAAQDFSAALYAGGTPFNSVTALPSVVYEESATLRQGYFAPQDSLTASGSLLQGLWVHRSYQPGGVSTRITGGATVERLRTPCSSVGSVSPFRVVRPTVNGESTLNLIRNAARYYLSGSCYPALTPAGRAYYSLFLSIGYGGQSPEFVEP